MFTRARVLKSQEQSNQHSRGEKATRLANNPALALQRAQALPAAELSASAIFALQRTVGNRAVQQMLAAQLAAPQASTATPRPVIQAKLMVGPANDHYEQEADRMAHQVTSEPAAQNGAQSVQRQTDEEEPMQRKPLAASITPLVQRQPAPSEDEELQTKRTGRGEGFAASREVEDRLQASRGSGSPLPEGLRSSMERSFGTGFENVRVHTDGQAAQLNQSLNARAFTRGSDIHFGQGAYNPNSASGRHLLAHELTHVVQQGGARSDQDRVRRKVNVTQSSESTLQRVTFDPGLAYMSARPRRERKEEQAQPNAPGRLARAWDWLMGKKKTGYDPVQSRQKPALVSSGISATGSVASGVGNLVSVMPTVSSIAASSGGGSAAGILGAIAGPVNAVSGVYNTVRGEDTRQKAEGGLSAVAGLGQTFTGTAVAVDSISKLANVASTGTRFLSAAVLPAQIAMGAVDTVRGIYGLTKAIDRQFKLKELTQQFGADTEAGRFAEFANQYQHKRVRTAQLTQASGQSAIIGAALLLSGVAAPAGIAFLALSGLLKVGSVFGGWLRDKIFKDEAKKKRAEEDRWTNYVEERLRPENADSRESQNVEQILKTMGMHNETITKLKAEVDPAKRFAIIRTLIMRR